MLVVFHVLMYKLTVQDRFVILVIIIWLVIVVASLVVLITTIPITQQGNAPDVWQDVSYVSMVC